MQTTVDGTSKNQTDLVAVVAKLTDESGTIIDIVLGLAIPAGKTAVAEADCVQHLVIDRLRTYLVAWRETHKRMFPDEPLDLPDPSDVGLHRLGGDGSIVTDGCNQARALQMELSKRVEAEVASKTPGGAIVQRGQGQDRTG